MFTEAERGAEIDGFGGAFDTRSAEISGIEVSERGAEIDGAGLDPYCPAPSPFNGQANPFTSQTSPFESKVDPLVDFEESDCN